MLRTPPLLHARLARLVAVVLGSAVLCGAAASSASAATGFQDPSKNIRCATKGSSLTCVILRQTSKCGQTWTASGTLKRTGPAVMNFGCFSGMPFSAKKYSTLRVGKKKTIGGVTCVIQKSSEVRCTNKAGHGFGLKRTGSTSF